jgi:hypothetical protein
MGKPEAMPGRHDDRVMSAAIGVFLCTVGAKAWGVSGLLLDADGANIPRGTLAQEARPIWSQPPPVDPNAPRPIAPVDWPTPVKPWAPPYAGASAPELNGPGTPVPPGGGMGEVALSAMIQGPQRTAEGFLSTIRSRPIDATLPALPTCGNCLSFRKGIEGAPSFCAKHRWEVASNLPPCEVWEPLLDYTEQDPLTDIGGTGGRL